MFNKIKKLLIGKTLKNEDLQDEQLNVFWGLPILASDAISSVAYAGEEILLVFIAVIGILSYQYLFYTALAISMLLLLLVFSYRQTIDTYPSGGGAYIVAKDNIGVNAGLFAGAALIIDYILTVAVSASAGTAALISMMPFIIDFRVEITVSLIVIMTVGNLRGVKESSRIFGIPTYLFLVSMFAMIIIGIVKVAILHQVPSAIPGFVGIPEATGSITIFLLLRGFAAGCTALTGVEAVSNSIPNFKEPAQKNAKRVLALLALLVLLIFGGASYLTTMYHADPTNHQMTVLSQIAWSVFNGGFMFYVIQITTAVILTMAANTSFSGLPMLLSLIAKDGYAPRQFAKRGERLGYSNGILLLSAAAIILVMRYGALPTKLLPLYAIGVFISFTLSQSGMFMRWISTRKKGWIHKSIINGTGAVVTFITVIVIAVTKFAGGAWMVIILLPFLVWLMKQSKDHYDGFARQLKLTPESVVEETEAIDVQKHVVVLVSSLNKASLKAISYASDLCEGRNIVAFHVSLSVEESKKIKDKWIECGLDIPLIIKYSPYRELINPLISYIESEEHKSSQGDMITVVMPQFVVSTWWHSIYHNQTANAIRKRLLKDRHVAVVTVPFVLDR